jgi:hypothetical protein
LKNDLTVFKSDKFDAANAADLSLFLYPSSIHIFVKDKNMVNIAQYYQPNFDWNQLNNLIESDTLLSSNLPARVFLHHESFCLVPDTVFLKEKEATYLSFSAKLESSSSFFSTALDKNTVHVVSSISALLKSTIENHFPIINYHHGSVSFLSYLFKERLYQIGQEILITVFDKQGYFAVSVYQDLTAFNRFEIKGKEDIVKYAMVLVSQLKLDLNLVRISIFADKNDEFPKEYFEQFFHHVRIIKPFGNQKFEFEHPEQSNLFESSWQMD